jgi:hypothetical protein
MWRSLVLVATVACGHSSGGVLDVDAAAPRADAPEVDRSPLEVQALGVQGFVLRHGSDVVLTAPLFTRQSAIDVALGLPITPDVAAIDRGLTGVPLDKLRAVISGHAHYDHFLDVPRVLEAAPGATAYTNLTGRHVLAALAPDRPASCTTAPASPVLARDRVIAMDDPLASHVDYTNCPDQRPAGAPLDGSWLAVPDSHVRVMAFCSMHPAQIGPYHFGVGSIDDDQCDLPAAAAGWLEGQTLAFVIDFLDGDGTPAFRVFYQDAPTDAPIGQVPPAVLAGAPVDLALLCVGSNDAVADEPTAILANITPRFGLSGHWEDFFAPEAANPPTLPFLDLATYVQRATAALAGPADAALIVDGEPAESRHVLAMPGMKLSVPRRE